MPQVYNTSPRAWAQRTTPGQAPWGTTRKQSPMGPLAVLAELEQPPGGYVGGQQPWHGAVLPSLEAAGAARWVCAEVLLQEMARAEIMLLVALLRFQSALPL